ncbi:DUF2490 domain-containing protein [Sphingomonas montana]|uniref:DUF2490 domain-containing protein n=1 Tax=Sphingomonas montana TaxID=1843236 RepID=UPI001F0B47E5|nr:DUF2490 domain-containing protein [Sphingomonas montana]
MRTLDHAFHVGLRDDNLVSLAEETAAVAASQCGRMTSNRSSFIAPQLTINVSICPLRALVGSALLLLVATPAQAQQEDEQFWLQVNSNVPVTDKLRLTLEQIGRLSDAAGGLFHTELGGIVSYRASAAIEFGVGYRHVSGHNGNRADDESRIRQHVVATFGAVTTRLRLDERFHPDGDEIGFRIRPFIRYTHPLGRNGSALFVSHESFYLPNSTRWGQRRGYERMRNTAGFVLPLSRRLSADVGYLNQFRPERRGTRAQMEHALSTQLTINLGRRRERSSED